MRPPLSLSVFSMGGLFFFLARPPQHRRPNRGESHASKLVLLAIVAAVIGLAVFWFRDHSGHGTGQRLGCLAVNPWNGREMLLCWRLRIVPRHARSGRQAATRAEDLACSSPFGTFYGPEYLLRSEGRYRLPGRSTNSSTPMLKGTSPERLALFPGLSRTRPII